MNLDKLNKSKSLIISGLISGLSVAQIRLLLAQNKVRIKQHELSTFITHNRHRWALDLLTQPTLQTLICEQLKIKSIKRKRVNRLPIKAENMAVVIQITQRNNTLRQALPTINNFLKKQNEKTISYDTLCRFIRKLKEV